MNDKGISSAVAGIILIVVVVGAVAGVYVMQGGDSDSPSDGNGEFNTSTSFDTPEDTVKTYLSAINDQDADLMYQCFSQRAGIVKGEIENMFTESENPLVAKTVDITEKTVEDNAAYVSSTVTLATENGNQDLKTQSATFSFSLVMENGKWKLSSVPTTSSPTEEGEESNLGISGSPQVTEGESSDEIVVTLADLDITPSDSDIQDISVWDEDSNKQAGVHVEDVTDADNSLMELDSVTIDTSDNINDDIVAENVTKVAFVDYDGNSKMISV